MVGMTFEILLKSELTDIEKFAVALASDDVQSVNKQSPFRTAGAGLCTIGSVVQPVVQRVSSAFLSHVFCVG